MHHAPEERAASTGEYTSLFVEGAVDGGRPVVLLHGSNGDERDLLGLAAEILPGVARLAIRGDVLMSPGFSFFRRSADRRVDVDDLRTRASRLARFIDSTCVRSGWAEKSIVVGYSNGAIMGAALLLDAPDVLAGAVLLRPLLPFKPLSKPNLVSKPVLIVDGIGDGRRAPWDGEDLHDALLSTGASVQRETSSSGHALGSDDVAHLKSWISG